MTRLQAPRATTAVLETRVSLDGEIMYSTDDEQLRIGDGATYGGVAIASLGADNVFTGTFTLSAAAPRVMFNETDQATSEQNWWVGVQGASYHIATSTYANPDARVEDAVKIDRNGTQVTGVDIPKLATIPLGSTNAEAQAIIDALPSTGGIIRLCAGTYDLTNLRLDGSDGSKSNVTLEGAGPATLIRKPSHADLTTDALRKSNVVWARYGHGFTVRNLTIEGNQSRGGLTPPYCLLHALGDTFGSVDAILSVSLAGGSSARLINDRIVKVTALGAGQVSSLVNISVDIGLGYVTDVTSQPFNETTGAGYVNGYYIDDDFAYRAGIALNGLDEAMEDIAVENCVVTDCIYAGILKGSGPLYAGNPNTGFGTLRARIHGNVVYNNGASNIGGGNAVSAVITHNESRDTDSSGIRCDSGSHYSIVANNVIDCQDVVNSNGGVNVYASDHVSVTGNTITGTSFGINFNVSDFGVASGNSIWDVGYGIVATSADHCSFSTNAISDTRSEGIRLIGGANNSIVGNAIESAGKDGIELDDASSCTVVGNSVYSSDEHGINLNSTATHNTVTGNVCRDNNADGAAHGAGIYCNGTYNAITGNHCFDARSGGAKTQEYGIYLDTSAASNVVSGNSVALNKTGDISDNGTSTARSGNTNGHIYYNGHLLFSATTNGEMYLGGASGAENFRVAQGTNPVNTLVATGGGTGVGPLLSVDGANTDIDLRIAPKGAGIVDVTGPGRVSVASSSTPTPGVATLTLQNTDAGAAGASLVLFANSASPAASDFAARIRAYGRDSAANSQFYGAFDCVIDDPTSTSEDSHWTLTSLIAGAATLEATCGGGVLLAAATGGLKGAGTMNATAVYDDNSLVSCFVFEAAIDGKVTLDRWDAMAPDRTHPDVFEDLIEEREREVEEAFDVIDADGKSQTLTRKRTIVQAVTVGKHLVRPAYVEPRIHDGARKFAARLGTEYDPLTLDGYAKHWRDKGHLTAMPNEVKFDPVEDKLSAGEWIQRALETMEIQAVLIEKLNERTKAQDARLEKLEA